VEMREARARYYRCVYETTPVPERVPAMLDAMNLQARLSGSRFDVHENNHPMFCDVMDCRTGELPQRDQFLQEWRQALRGQGSDRADMLLLEAVYLMEGLPGVQSLVRTWGARQPRAWLFWIWLLVSEDDWPAVAAVGEEALPVVGDGQFRALIAEKLLDAGAEISRPDLVLKGRREVFCSVPGEAPLLQLIEEAERQNLRDAELEQALEFVCSRENIEKTLLVKLLLMTGRIEAAFDKARKIRALGWSYGEGAGAMLFAAVLSLLCLHRIEAAVVIRRVLKRYGDSGHAGHAFDGESKQATEDRAGRGICSSEEILRGLQKASVSEEQKHRYLSWALETGRKRIEQIVSNKHRGAYDRAAETLGALAECYLLNGEEKKSRSLIDEYRNQRYNRYPAFRRELDSLIAVSGPLHWKPPGGT